MRLASAFAVITFLAFGLSAGAMAGIAAPAGPVDRVDGFVARLDARVPELLLRDLVPSAAVAVVHEGRIVTRTWGLADVGTGRIATNQTRYNIASISKLLTAWGVMRLVEEGKVRLDDPVSKHVKRWRLPPSGQNDDVTIRRLLSHTSGLSMPAVPWYGPDQTVPSLEEMLQKDPLHFVDRPGKAIHYSGGGFALLQLLIEEVSGVSYEAYMQQRILAPLGMSHSSFITPREGDVTAAVPYDASVRPLPHYRFAAPAAAGMYTTIDDVAAFAAATLGRTPAPLSPQSIVLTQTPVTIEEKTPFRYGLGESLIALPSGTMTTGHAGSNEGWTCVLAGVPSSGDALVVLTNRSDAFPLYRDLLCEWLSASAGETWPRFCAAQPITWSRDDSAFVDGLFASASEATPGAVVLVAIGDEIVHRKAYGAADPIRHTALTPETPFYIASLAKSLTSFAVLDLVAAGRMSLADPISRFIPDVPPWAANVTIEQLLSHTSGIPSYQTLIEWQSYDGIDNAEVLGLLRAKARPLFAAGSRYAYSNSGYALLATAIEKVSGSSFHDFLAKRVFDPLGMRATSVYVGATPAPAARALGYSTENGRLVLSDYLAVTLPNGETFPFRSTTVGSGGMFSTVDDLLRFSRAYERVTFLPLALQFLSLSPRIPVEGEIEQPDTKGHGFGWFLSRRGKANLVWNEGSMAGHKTILLRLPQYNATLIILSNSGATNPNELATAIVDRLLAAGS
jgi:CubicO group peptidase (beta-lactamase class C family)